MPCQNFLHDLEPPPPPHPHLLVLAVCCPARTEGSFRQLPKIAKLPGRVSVTGLASVWLVIAAVLVGREAWTLGLLK